MNEKEFGNLSLSQLKEMAALLLAMKPQRTELTRAAKEDKKQFLHDAPEDFSWCDFYNLSLIELVCTVLWLGKLDDQVRIAKEQDDPQQYILDTFKSLEPDVRNFCGDIKYAEYTFVASVIALMKSLEAIEVYGSSLNRLMRLAVEGDNKAVRDIVSLDHSAVGNAHIASRIAIAELRQDKKFLIQVNKALRGKPKKYKVEYGPIRYLLATLNELSLLDKFSTDDFYQLFCLDLELYPCNGSDPARSLMRFIDRWKKGNATPFGDFVSSPSQKIF